MKILITFGGTREPIDGVRFISNFSTGATGAYLTDFFRGKGWEVLALQAKDCMRPTLPGPQGEFLTTADIDRLLRESLGSERFDAIIHLAAISDYSLEAIEADGVKTPPNYKTKMNSEAKTMSLHLKKNEKIISKLKSYSKNPNLIVVGFKLTNNAGEKERLEAVKKVFQDSKPDLIVQNDLSEIIDSSIHISRIFQNSKQVSQAQTKREMAQSLYELIEQFQPGRKA